MEGKTSAELAYEHTKGLIIRGDLKPAELISEVAVAEALGISRTPVHEAFLRLETERLLILYPRKGASVQGMSVTEARDVVDMRCAIECAAVERALSENRIPDEAWERINAALNRGDAAAEAGDAEAFSQADEDLHGELIACSGNATASQLYDVLRTRQARLRLQTLRSTPEHVKTFALEHREILEAFQARDMGRYRQALIGHLSHYL